MRVFFTAFVGGFVGRVVAALFIALCIVMGIGPDKWAAYLVLGLEDWVTPGMTRIAFLIFAAITFALVFGPSCYRAIRHSVAAPSPDRSIAAERSDIVDKALAELPAHSIAMLRAILITGRPSQFSDDAWKPLEAAGLVERDFVGPKGIKDEFRPIIEAKLAESVALRRANRAKLEEFYMSIGQVLNERLPRDLSNAEFEQYVTRSNRCITDAADWIGRNMGPATRERFLDRDGMLAAAVHGAINERHNSIILNLTRYRQNLKDMMESAAWV